MKVPKGMTEQQVIEIVESIIARLSNKYTFGFHAQQDIAQEAWLFAIDGLERHDGKRPLENFLFVHIRNRLINFRRDKFTRKDIPCKRCPFYKRNEIMDDKCGKFDKRMDCPEFAVWKQRNHLKKELCSSNCNVSTYDSIDLPSNVNQDTEIKELKALIDKHLDISLRADYLKMLAGVSVPKTKKMQIENAIKSIIARREQIGPS